MSDEPAEDRSVRGNKISPHSIGDGVPVKSVSAEREQTGKPPADKDLATLSVRTGGKQTSYTGKALALQNLDDTVGTGVGRANMLWVTASGYQTFIQTAHPTDAHYSWYIRDRPDWASGAGNIKKIMNVGPGQGGTGPDEIGYDTAFDVITHKSARQLNIKGGADGVSSSILFNSNGDSRTSFLFQHDGDTAWALQYRQDLGDIFRFRNSVANEEVFHVDAQTNDWLLKAETDFEQNPSSNVVWESGDTSNRPNSPVVGQRFFDSDLGQPIWYDGSDWVDAQGSVV